MNARAIKSLGGVLCVAIVAWPLLGAPALSAPAQAPVDTAIQWNARLLDAFRAAKSSPPAASRELAMLNVAIFDAVNAASGRPFVPYRYSGLATGDATAAAKAAAQAILAALHPDRSPPPTAVDEPGPLRAGQAIGREAAREILAARANDGAELSSAPYFGGTAPGVWRPTLPEQQAGIAPHWAAVLPWALNSVLPYRPPGPPALNSQQWADNLAAVAALGAAGSKIRTPAQTEAVLFWADGDGTETPAGHWIDIAGQLARAQGLDLLQSSRLLALISIAEADAAIVAWDAKYHFANWRPSTALRAAGDRGWSPLLATPAFPEYISGHSMFSAAAAETLCLFFSTDAIPFSVGTDAKELPGTTHLYQRFSAAADEAGWSRIWGGVHLQYSHVDGQNAGRKVADAVFETVLLPAGRPAAKAVCRRSN